MKDEQERMYEVLLSRPGWHEWQEIAKTCGLGPERSDTLRVYHELLNAGYTRIERHGGSDFDRYRLVQGRRSRTARA